MIEIEMVSIVVKRPCPTKGHGARDKANFDSIERVYQKNMENKKSSF